MINKFEFGINNAFSLFLKKNKFQRVKYRYEEGAFGNGIAEYTNYDGVQMRFIRDRSQWYISFRKTNIEKNWYDLFLFLEYRERQNFKMMNEFYDDFNMSEDEHLRTLLKILENEYEKIIEIFKDKNEYNLFIEFIKNST